MIDEATLAQMNGEYVMPEDAGPAWRAAHAAGVDMSLIEENLKLSPWERLVANDRALALAQALRTDGTAANAPSD
jgi:hypothetical protein